MIDELKKIRSLLFSDYSSFARIIDASPFMLWLTEKTETIYISRSLRKFTGKTLGKVLNKALLNKIHPDDIALYKKTLQVAFKKELQYDVEYRLKHHTGDYRWIKEEGIPVFFRGDTSYKGFICGCTDIDSQKKIEIKLWNSEERYRRLFETARDGILILNSHSGEIIDVNPFLSELLGFSKEEFLGKKLWEVGAFKNIKTTKETFKSLQETGYVKYDNLPLETKDGRLIAVGFVSNAYLTGNERVIQCNIRDISEQKRLEESEKALILLKQDKIKTSFIADVTHELRTPLAIIKGNVELALRAKYDKDTVQETFHAINIEINHLAEMLSDLSILTTENQDFYHAIKKQKTNLTVILHDTVERVRKISLTKNITLTLQEDFPITVFGNKDYLKKLFSNILSNAIFYGKKNGTVTIFTTATDSMVNIIITDNGIGIPSEDLPKIFDRFYRTETAREVNREGTGLGLAISKWIVDVHKGEIQVSSTLNKGTTVTITLPIFE